MLHAVTLPYRVSEENIALYLEAHKAWLVRGFNEKRVVFAGPIVDGSGGYILFHDDSASAIEAFLKEDPFVIHQLVNVDRVSVEPALGAVDFPDKWAGKARRV